MVSGDIAAAFLDADAYKRRYHCKFTSVPDFPACGLVPFSAYDAVPPAD